MTENRYRPDAIAALYENLGAPCTQCGRRFKSDEEGKKKKMAHMDWHFGVHQRTTEAEKRGTHRSWYVDHKVRYPPEQLISPFPPKLKLTSVCVSSVHS